MCRYNDVPVYDVPVYDVPVKYYSQTLVKQPVRKNTNKWLKAKEQI